MIHEAFMPVYRCPDFHCAGGSTRGSTRGPRGPKKNAACNKIIFVNCIILCIRADLTFDSISKSPAGKVQHESTHEMDMGMMIRGGVAPSLYQIQTSSGEKMPTREGKRKPKLKKKNVNNMALGECASTLC